MKNNWQTKTLGEVCKILDSKRKPITKRDRTSGEYPYYGATGILDYVKDYLFDEKLVLIGEDGAKWGSGDNTAFTAKGKYWVNNHAHVIRPLRDIILDEWIIYFLNFQDLSKYITGLTVPKLNQSKLREIKIPLPPLPIQKAIVKILDEVFESISKSKENAEKNLKNAKELFESYLEEIFSNPKEDWEEKKLEKLGNIFSGNSINEKVKKTKYLNIKEGMPYVATKDVSYENEINYENGVKIPEKDLGKFRIAHKNSVFICAEGGSAGRKLAFNIKDVCFVNKLFAFEAKEIIEPKLIYYFYQSDDFQKQFKSRMTGLIGGVSMSKFKDIEVLYPISLEKQTLIVQKLDALSAEIKKLEQVYSQKLKDLEELKKSMLQKAFSGELTN